MITETQFALRKDVRPDPQQPRRDFPAAAQEELRDSIKVNGIQDAIIVRADPEQKTKWMIVEGERRFRIATELNLDRLPVIVREFKDEAAVRTYQRIAGTQRLNLSALEAANAFGRELQAARTVNPKVSVTDFARAQGIPRSVAYESLALLKITPVVRQALDAGQLTASHARLFAKVPPEQHAEFLKDITLHDGDLLSVRDAEDELNEHYARQLNAATFDAKASYIVPVNADQDKKGGAMKTLTACAACPQRSGNIEGWTGDNANVCTNVPCFDAKTKAAAQLIIEQAKADKKPVVAPEAYDRHSYNYAKPAEKCYSDAKGRTWGQLAKEAGIEPSVTVADGVAVKVITPADKKTIAAKLLRDPKAEAQNQKDQQQYADKQEAVKLAIRDASFKASYLLLERSQTQEFLQKLARSVIGLLEYELDDETWTARNLKPDAGVLGLEKYIRETSVENVVGLIVQSVLSQQVDARNTDALAIWGVDWKKFLPGATTVKTVTLKEAQANQAKSPTKKPKAAKAAKPKPVRRAVTNAATKKGKKK